MTRRLFRDGTSEYLINKVPCRLRDIQELMAGTGAGTRGYSIIEQGQVGRIVSSKAEERRYIIDEAAGITRFKAQKQAAEKKIEQTQQNLLRVSDVLSELEARVGNLRRQAQKAERYKRYRPELRDLDLWIASHRFLELEATRRVLEKRRGELGEQVDGVGRHGGGPPFGICDALPMNSALAGGALDLGQEVRGGGVAGLDAVEAGRLGRGDADDVGVRVLRVRHRPGRRSPGLAAAKLPR